MTAANRGKRRSLWLNLTLLGMAVGFAVGIAEIALRLLPSEPSTRYRTIRGGPLFEPDTLLGWRPVANGSWTISSPEYEIGVETNELGLRTGDLGSLADDECVVLVLGDSFVQGLTVDREAHFASVAQARLSSLTGRRCRVIPAGVEGYATEQQLLFLATDLAHVPADVVVHFFFFNDVLCNHPARNCQEEQARLQFPLDADSSGAGSSADSARRKPEQPRDPPADSLNRQVADGSRWPLVRLRAWLLGNSRVYRLVRNTLREPPRGRGRPTAPFRSTFFVRPLPDVVSVFRAELDAETESAWQRTERLLTAMSDTAEAKGMSFAVFHVPARETIHADQWDTILGFHGWRPSDWDPDGVRRRLREACDRHRLSCFSPADTLRSIVSRGGEPYLFNDPHWSREGHRIVGELLAAQLLDMFELPR